MYKQLWHKLAYCDSGQTNLLRRQFARLMPMVPQKIGTMPDKVSSYKAGADQENWSGVYVMFMSIASSHLALIQGVTNDKKPSW